MNILVLSQMFPCKRHPTSAIFFANLLKELVLKIDNLIIVTPRPYIPKIITKMKKELIKWYLDPIISNENGMKIIRPYFLYVPGESNDGINSIMMQYSLSRLFNILINEHKIDIVLGYNMIPDGIAAVRLANKFNLPVGFWAIGTDVNTIVHRNRINHYLSKKCIESSDIVITESIDLENKITKITNHSNNVKTFYKGIDISTFRNLPSKASLFNKLQLDHRKRYLLFVGRLIYDKGIYELAQAFINVAKKHSNIELVLLGEELEKEKLTEMFSLEALLHKVHFRGIVPHNKVAYYMKLSDMLVFPSWAEGLPNVVMEAMAIGLPVVASDVGGIPELLKDGVNGLVVPPRNVEMLTDSVLKMLQNDELRSKCIINATKIIEDKFNVKKNASNLFDILQDIIINYSMSH